MIDGENYGIHFKIQSNLLSKAGQNILSSDYGKSKRTHNIFKDLLDQKTENYSIFNKDNSESDPFQGAHRKHISNKLKKEEYRDILQAQIAEKQMKKQVQMDLEKKIDLKFSRQDFLKKNNGQEASINSQEYENIKQTYPSYSYPHLNPQLALKNPMDFLPDSNKNNINDKNNIFLPNNFPINYGYSSLPFRQTPEQQIPNEYFSPPQTKKEPNSEKKPNYARNLRGRLGFFSETPEEIMKKEQQKNEYKEYIQSQIEEKKKKKENEKQLQIQKELNEEKKFLKQQDDLKHILSDSRNFDKNMKNIFEQKNEMESEKRKLEKKMRNISNISDNNQSLNNNRNNNLNQSKINESTKILEDLNNNFVNPQRIERNVPTYNNLNAKLELEEIKNRFLLQQKNFFEELEILKLNAQKSVFDKSQAISEMNLLKNKIRNRVIDNISLLKESYKNESNSNNFRTNVVKYSQLYDSEFPIVKYGMDQHLMKKLFYPDELPSDKLNNLINEDYQKNYLLNSINSDLGNKEFKGESEFISTEQKQPTVKNVYEKNTINRLNSLDSIKKTEENALNNEKRPKSETKISESILKQDKVFQAESKFVPFDGQENLSFLKETNQKDQFAKSLAEIYEILKNIDQIQKENE